MVSSRSWKSDRTLTTSYVKELHAALLRNQRTAEVLDVHGKMIEVQLIRGAWKAHPNHPKRNGVTYYYCPPEQVDSEMDRLIEMHEAHVSNGVSAEVQAAWLHHRFTQIHPFQDGNGRVVRAIASLVLVKDGLFPLVVRRDDRSRYLEALEAADRGNLKAVCRVDHQVTERSVPEGDQNIGRIASGGGRSGGPGWVGPGSPQNRS